MLNIFKKKRQDNNLSKKVIKVAGMDCSACATALDIQLEELKGVKKAQTNYAKQEIEIEFDPKLTSVNEFIKVIKTHGYPASAIS